MRSKKEMEDKLKERGYDEDIILDIIYKLSKLDYLNDDEFAKSFIRTRLNAKRHGPKKVKYDLKLKGISSNIIDKNLSILYNSDIEYKICSHVYDKNKHRYNDNQKIVNFLLNRGFNYNVVKDIV